VEYRTKVKLVLEDAGGEWVSGAIVCLYDRDRLTRDDHLGTNVTNLYGEAEFRFSSRDFLDLDDRIGGSLPELFVKVYDSDGRCVITTRAAAEPNAVPALIRVAIPRKLALAHGLIRD
jgi:hypothetical protein